MNGFQILNLATTATESAAATAAHNGKLDLFQLLMASGSVVWIILGLLGGLSIACWYIIGYKFIQFRKTEQEDREFQEIFWKTKNMENIQKSAQEMEHSAIAKLFTAGYTELMRIKNDEQRHLREQTHKTRAAGGDPDTHTRGTPETDTEQKTETELTGGAALLNHAEAAEAAETIARSIKRAQTIEVNKREKMIPLLGTTSSTAPFIGLFGTVWGIMDSFLSIGSQHSASLATVAPGIAEALITTAIGLAAAIPAVVAYNHYINRLRLLSMEMDTFNNDFINIAKRHFLR